ncbi:MAG: DUF3769 domain-containing protein [Phormidesmis sp. RL_2_1]|nr:DUF3769 domain-containing protein [Phormidesmis sp. RL_2_1]
MPVDVPALDVPAVDVPAAEETPAEETPAEETPAEEMPGQAVPARDMPAGIEMESEEEMTPEALASQLRLTADYQSYDPQTQIVTARGNVVLILNDAVIEANQLWVNLINRYALATGNVLLTRGAQIVRGSRAEYNFIQQSGVIRNAQGTLYLPEVESDFSSPLEGASSTTRRAYAPLNPILSPNEPLAVTSDGSVQITTSPETTLTGGTDGELRQLRFETDELLFDVEGWRAEGVRITNDPFSPPELEFRTDSLVLRNLSPTQDELLFKRPRLVFDQGLAIPLLRSRLLLRRGRVDPEELSPVPVAVGVDGRDRGGFFIGRKIPLVKTERVQFALTPQFSVARAFSGENGSIFSPSNFGLAADLDVQLTPRTALRGRAGLTSLNLTRVTENLRTNVRLEQRLGNHLLQLQYSYRDRLFNGSLGFQDVQSSLGAVLLSPVIALNPHGLSLNYQASAQLINATSDRTDLLLASGSNTGRITLGRYQVSAALRQVINLWRGEPKVANQDEGLRFTPSPVVPFLDLSTGLRMTSTYYSSRDAQNSLIADISINGQLGHFSRNFGDYTRFNLGYSQSFIGGADSPLFV